MPKGQKKDLDLNKDPSSKTEAKEMQAKEAYQERKEHSNQGSNTKEHQGMEYVSRKTHSADVPHSH